MVFYPITAASAADILLSHCVIFVVERIFIIATCCIKKRICFALLKMATMTFYEVPTCRTECLDSVQVLTSVSDGHSFIRVHFLNCWTVTHPLA